MTAVAETRFGWIAADEDGAASCRVASPAARVYKCARTSVVVARQPKMKKGRMTPGARRFFFGGRVITGLLVARDEVNNDSLPGELAVDARPL